MLSIVMRFEGAGHMNGHNGVVRAFYLLPAMLKRLTWMLPIRVRDRITGMMCTFLSI